MPVAGARSILFASVTAEEQGLLGSEYLRKHSPRAGKNPGGFEFRRCAAAGNARRSGSQRCGTDDVLSRGAGDRAGFSPGDPADSRPEAGHYYRSDHFSLARVGVPSFSINEGIKFAGHDAQWGDEQAKDFTVHRYHSRATSTVRI